MIEQKPVELPTLSKKALEEQKFSRINGAVLTLRASGHEVRKVNYTTGEISFVVREMDDVMEKIHEFIRANRPIEAIKLYREHYNVGLPEAKRVIDQIRGIRS